MALDAETIKNGAIGVAVALSMLGSGAANWRADDATETADLARAASEQASAAADKLAEIADDLAKIQEELSEDSIAAERACERWEFKAELCASEEDRPPSWSPSYCAIVQAMAEQCVEAREDE